MPSDPPIVGRPAVLWQLRNATSEMIWCETGELESGSVRVRVLRSGEECLSSTFADAAAAIRWAIDVQRSLLDHGWIRNHYP